MNRLLLSEKLREFFIEDIGTGDLSASVLANQEIRASFIAKEDGVFCGKIIVLEGYRMLDSAIQITCLAEDGESVKAGSVLIEVSGPAEAILSGERVILNLVQRMSGIATETKRACVIAGDQVKIADTRKTVPGLRMFDKYAVKCGGGHNHRFGLYDGIMLKENHIAAAGGIMKAVSEAKEKSGHMQKIEVEIETYEQLSEAVKAGADIIMFDNVTPEVIANWLSIVPDHILTEASGGITLENLSMYAGSGVDVISLGYLTHSVKSLDISLVVKGAVKHDTAAVL
ncbi:carboxylating nicotinate-nucleotide diphosphorylase [Fictibacillus aquaticus]|uniref:Probable nicotinate-nucleotide pyrophosphorylase [carboxylating] n=1 Tax=Fictibacillus aquaticus TaxID=2021314 RepID=A0A235FAQ1_9BACL|nr:carboxylating nicotinate-nucleotide diphosphorylase [Fictibacillus aquaticus]OYD58053.1 nicotinate-nucleotide diphosphorylase (carboxylating) [Fictibacillus aquaticus]